MRDGVETRGSGTERGLHRVALYLVVFAFFQSYIWYFSSFSSRRFFMSGTDPRKTALRSPCFFGPPGTFFRPPRRAGTDTGTDLGKGFLLYARFFLPFCLFFAFLGFYLYVTAFPLCFTSFLPLVSGRILGKTCKTAVLRSPPGLSWLYFRPFPFPDPVKSWLKHYGYV